MGYRYLQPIFCLIPEDADDWDCTTFALPGGITPFANGMQLSGVFFYSSAANDVLHLRHGGDGATYPPMVRARDATGDGVYIPLPGNLYKVYLEGNRCVFGTTSQVRIIFYLY